VAIEDRNGTVGKFTGRDWPGWLEAVYMGSCENTYGTDCLLTAYPDPMMPLSGGIMTEQSFASVWGLSYSDLEFLRRFGARSQVMIGCQLLYLRRYGRFPGDRSELDPDVVDYVADQTGVDDDPEFSFPSDTARRQRGFILDYLGLRRASQRDRTELQVWMVEHLGGCDLNLADWVARGYGQALRVGVFVPSDKIMERLVRAARREFREGFLSKVVSRLSPGTAEQLERVLSEPLAATGFHGLKDDVGTATLESVLLAAQKGSFVEDLHLPMDLLDGVDRGWIRQLSRLVEGETAFEMRRHTPERRLGLLTIYLMHRKSHLIDGLVDLLLEVVHRIGTRSMRKVISRIAADIEKVHGKERLLVDIATAAVEYPEGRIEDVIFPVVGAAKLRAVIEEHRARGLWIRASNRPCATHMPATTAACCPLCSGLCSFDRTMRCGTRS